MLKQVIFLFAALVGADLVWLSIWLWTEQPSNDMAILGVVIPPVLAIANLGLGLLCWLLKQGRWRTVFLLNAVVAPVLYGVLLTSWFHYSLARQFAHFTFTQGPKQYTLTLTRQGNDFDILERQGPGAFMGLMRGSYQRRNDTTYLDDPHRPKRCFLHHSYLYHFEDSPHPILVRSTD